MSFFGRLIPWWLPWAVVAFLCAIVLGQRVQVSNAKAKVARSEKALAEYKLAVSETTRILQADTDRKRAEQLTREKEAANAARTREARLRDDAAGAQSELDRLRLAVRSAASRSAVPRPVASAKAEPAPAFGQLFESCAIEVQELAGIADRHASDVRTLMDSWPR